MLSLQTTPTVIEYDLELNERGFLKSITVNFYYNGIYSGWVHALHKGCFPTKDTLNFKEPTLIVTEASLDKKLHNQGHGKAMYEELIRVAHEYGFVVVPEKSLGIGNGHTSTKANRVWKSLRKKYINVGQGVIGVLK